MRSHQLPVSGPHAPSPRRIKLEAKQIRLQSPTIKHLEALDLVSKARGWPSYKALERAWVASGRGQSDHQVVLTARWVDRNGVHGALHAHVPLSEPWENHLPLTVRRQVSTLRQFHIFKGDRAKLVAKTDFASAVSAMHNLSKAARQLVFVDALRVHPASFSKTVEAFDGDPYKMLTERYPNQDHETLWCDPASGLHFILNEPYQVDTTKQGSVLTGKQMVVHTTREWTIHNPEGTLAQLIARSADESLFQQILKRTQRLPARFNQISFSDDAGDPVPLFQ